MNDFKKNLRLFAILAALFAGNIAFAPEGMRDNDINLTEEPGPEAGIRLEREAREKEQQRIKQEEAQRNESFWEKTKRQVNNALGRNKDTQTPTTSTPRFVDRSQPARRSTGEQDTGTELQTPQEAAAPDSDFDVIDRSSVPNAAKDLTTEEIEKLTPEDVNKFTTTDIKDLGMEIANLSPETFETLSRVQTVALTVDQITVLLANPELAPKLKIEDLNPTELSKVFQSRNIGSQLPDEIVARLTDDQINKILKDNPKKLYEYFTPDQIKEMKSKVSLKDKAQRGLKTAVKATTDWLNSTTVVKWLNKLGNSGRDLTQATIMARSKSQGTFDSAQQKAFESHLKTLTTKEKQDVANAWADARISKVRNIEEQIETIKKSNLPSNKRIQQIDALRKQLTAMDNEMMAFRDELQTTLPRNEVVIPLQAKISKGFFDSAQSGDKVFEIVDMNKIDPTKSIEAQYADLKSTGFFGLKDPVVNRINPNDLLKEYSSWIANDIKISSSVKVTVAEQGEKATPVAKQGENATPIAEQLEKATVKLTGKKWSELDPSIKAAIFVRLGKDVQEQFNKEAEEKNTAGAARAKKELQNIVLAMNPEEIKTLSVEEIENLEPDTVAELSEEQIQALNTKQIKALNKKQIQALNLDQIDALSPEQYNALDFTKLRPVTIAVMLAKMPAEKIATLTQEQLQALPKGRLSARLATLSLSDLQNLEDAFTSENNPFAKTVAREITRQTAEAPVNSYKGDFDIHRIAINNARTLNTRPENIPSLSLDVVRDLDAETARKMSNEQVNAFTEEQLNVLGTDALNVITPRLTAEAIKELSPTAITLLTPTTFSQLSSDAIEDLTPQQAEVVTKDQIKKLNNKQKTAVAKSKEKYSIAKAKDLNLNLNEKNSQSKKQSASKKGN